MTNNETQLKLDDWSDDELTELRDIASENKNWTVVNQVLVEQQKRNGASHD